MVVCSLLLGAVLSGEWQNLIEKDNFQHWRSPSGKTDVGGAWSIRKGVLTTKPYVHRRTDLWSAEEYSDFELEWQWKPRKGANSGVKYWVQTAVNLVIEEEDKKFRRIADVAEAKPDETLTEFSLGLEYQMADDEFEPVSIQRKDSRSGGLYSLFAPQPEAVKKHGKWNHSRLLVRGGHVEHWLNGKKTLEYDRAKLAEQMKKTPLRYVIERERGPIALQYHQTVVSFRKMRIRRL
ncbi:MAG: DUF1080 domain-containing protein [Acidobacteria bacterium]|nr:DUF1080 domain-containing protein [Acidobacteriota bacterium]